MVERARKLATNADLLALPEDVRAEVIRGSIEVLPAPRPRHSKVQDGSWMEVGSWGEGDVARIAPFVDVELAVGRLFLPRSAAGDATE